PSEEELQRAKTEIFAGFIRGVERIGGFGGKSDVLASSAVYRGTPDGYKDELEVIRSATASQVKEAAERWLTDGQYVLSILPYPPGLKASDKGADRAKLPDAGTAPDGTLPAVQKVTLSNGMKVLLAERHAIPVVDFSLMIDAGYTADAGGIP